MRPIEVSGDAGTDEVNPQKKTRVQVAVIFSLRFGTRHAYFP
jgi:hypothetical protein